MRKNFLFLHLRKRAHFPARQSRLELLPAILVPPKPICVYLMSARIRGITLRSLKRWAQGWLNGVVRWSRKKIHETFDRLLAEPCALQKNENGYCLPASKTHSSLILFSGDQANVLITPTLWLQLPQILWAEIAWFHIWYAFHATFISDNGIKSYGLPWLMG